MRCKACDSILKPEEIIWIPDRESHEELCRVCRYSIQVDMTHRVVLGQPEDDTVTVEDSDDGYVD